MLRKLLICLAAISLTAIAPAVAAPPKCQLVKYLDLPVQLIGRRAIVTTQIGGKEARFILDSGAFYSTMSRATATEFHVPLESAPPRFHLYGINGSTSVDIGTVRNFTLSGVTLPQVQFLVGGTDTGTVGLLGQNFLNVFDVEYDFAHGMVRLMKASNCPDVTAAYWAGDKPVTSIALLQHVPPFKVQTVGSVKLNGIKLQAVFDTGAPGSGLTLSAAKRAGVTPQSPGVTEAGFSTGLGSKSIKAWMGTFASIDIGGETIPSPRLRFSDMDLVSTDMLIGFDFFLTHRILVMNSASRMLVTYEGGSVFGLTPDHARNADGTAIDLTAKDDGPPKDAEGFARRAAVLATQDKMEAALTDFDAAVGLAPNDARYLKLRAQARLANRQPLLALADLDKAITIDPADAETRMTRAALRLAARDPKGGLEDLQAADASLPPSSDKRLRLASLLNSADQHEAALADDELWLKYHPEDAQRPEAYNGRCWTRALLNRDLDKALSDCNAALRARPNTAAYLDSRALVHVRRSEWALAKADYDAALATAPRNALALYARGIARAKLGDAAGGQADRAAAVAIAPAIGERAKRLGLGLEG